MKGGEKMKTLIAVIITALITSASAFGAASWSHMQNGVWCKSSGINTVCIPTSAEGYGVGISRDAVMVMNLRTQKSVFQRYQP